MSIPEKKLYAYYKCEDDENGKTTAIYLEVNGECIIRQIERYNEAWIYSGDPLSYCHTGYFEAYGTLMTEPFSSLNDMPFRSISQRDFEQAWQLAKLSAKRKIT